MLKNSIYLLWFCFVLGSEFVFLAKLAKPYLLFRPTYLPHILNQLHCMETTAHQVNI